MNLPADVSVTPLTPLAFLGRSAAVFPDKTAVVYGERRLSYQELVGEVTRLARGLRASAVQPGDRIAYLCPNISEQVVAHFAVPLAGAVLVAINTRLAPEELRYICDDSGAVLLVADTELHPVVAPVAGQLKTVREVVTVQDLAVDRAAPPLVDGPRYLDLLARGSDEPMPWAVHDERAIITINYTSGTTGQPKGVLYTHRGAYLGALGGIVHSGFTQDSVYLWTLPMFHCNGWCTAWALAAVGGTQVCLRAVEPELIWRLIGAERVTHLNGASTVLTMLADSPQAQRLDRGLTVTTGGAPPSPTIIERMEQLGGRVLHVYGLTETYGPYTVCEWQPAWADEPLKRRAELQARQGAAMLQADPVRVVDEDMADVPRDASTLGEIIMRGNTVMAGYFNDPDATAAAFAGGWFHSGDLGVWNPDGYVELRDRKKDLIVSGGENISSVEVEHVLISHPAVAEAAVIGVPDPRWGERPKAFVVLKDGVQAIEADLIEYVHVRLARFKTPKSVMLVGTLPRNAAGKIRKDELREQEWAGQQRRIQG